MSEGVQHLAMAGIEQKILERLYKERAKLDDKIAQNEASVREHQTKAALAYGGR